MTDANGPTFDIAHLGHVELHTDRFDESLDFFTRVYGLKLSGRDATSAYLRAWDDYEFHTLKLTRHHTTGLGHVGYRAASPEALERRVAVIEASGFRTHGWVEGDMGHGCAFRFEDPFGHVFEIYHDTVWYDPPDGRRAPRAEEHRLGLHRCGAASDRPRQPPRADVADSGGSWKPASGRG